MTLPMESLCAGALPSTQKRPRSCWLMTEAAEQRDSSLSSIMMMQQELLRQRSSPFSACLAATGPISSVMWKFAKEPARNLSVILTARTVWREQERLQNRKSNQLILFQDHSLRIRSPHPLLSSSLSL